jgi:hypothetical protein
MATEWMMRGELVARIAGVAALLAGTVMVSGAGAFQLPRAPVQIDGDDVGGVVTGPGGPEAGVRTASRARRAAARG